MSTKPKKETDPLIVATKRAYRGSKQYQLDQLLKRRSYWQRKSTLAGNKLARVEEELRDMLYDMVRREIENTKDVIQFLKESADNQGFDSGQAVDLIRRLGGVQ